MVPVAFGTQTGGSVLRPAAYCGVFGFKPTFNAFNRQRRLSAAESLDTIGLIARTLDDARADQRRARNCARRRSRDARPRAAHRALPHAAVGHRAAGDRGRRRGRGRAARPGRRAGAARSCCRRNSPSCATPRARPSTITSAPPRWRTNGTATATQISERLRKRIEIGRAMPHDDYLAALQLGEDCRARLDDVFDGIDVLLAPCANGEAPRGLGDTGDPGFQAIWTILHTPGAVPADPSRAERPAGRHPARRRSATTTAGCSPARAGSGSSSARPSWSASAGSGAGHGIRQFVRGAAAAGRRPGRCCSTSSASRPACRARN